MGTVIGCLLLLLLTGLSAPAGRVLPVPRPLLQIGLGVLAGLAGLHVAFDPDTFLLLFIPPLLFGDAYTIPKRELFALRGVVTAMAIGLVLFSTLASGALVRVLLPAIPLAACFALGAVLSPTDAVAVGGMIPPGTAPKRFVHILEGEALLNDASGLVCFKFAAAAAMTGAFSVAHASLAFVAISAGGLAVGAALAWLFVQFERLVLLRAVADPATQIVLLALLPFAAYLAADDVGVSGILAAVGAGFTISQLRPFDAASTHVRLSADVVWEMMTFVFNGLVFLLLGMQLPRLVRTGVSLDLAAHRSLLWLPLGIVALTLGLVACRLIWIWAAIGLRIAAARLLGHPAEPRPHVLLSLAMSVAGVRGAVTLAGVLSLPVATGASPGFPHRDLLVVIAAGVILCSLVLAATTLPALVRRGGSSLPAALAEDADPTRRILLAAAAAELDRADAEPVADPRQQPPRAAAIAVLSSELHRRIGQLSPGAQTQENRLREMRFEAAMRLRVIRAQRGELTELIREKRVSADVEQRINRELDIEEELLLVGARSLPRARQTPG